MTPARRVKEWIGGRLQPSTGRRVAAKRRASRSLLAPSTHQIRVALVAKLEVRRHLAAILKRSADMRLVAGTADRRAAFNLTVRTKPDVVVLDADCDGELSGVAIGRRIQKAMPAIGIVLIAGEVDRVAAYAMARVFGTTWTYIHRRRLEDPAAVIHAVNSVDRSIQWVDPALNEMLAEVWKIAAEQRNAEDGMKSSNDRMASGVQQLTVRGYEGGRPRSFDVRSRERYDL